jgi:hypothetical protein
MSERDELARLIDPYSQGAAQNEAGEAADRVIAAGYRKIPEPGSSDIANLRRMAEERAESDPLAAMALDGCADEIEALRKRVPEPGSAEWQALVDRAKSALGEYIDAPIDPSNHRDYTNRACLDVALLAALHPQDRSKE